MNDPRALLARALAPLPRNWRKMTKDHLALVRLPWDWPYDVALPQEWLDQQAGGDDTEYQRILAHTVWVYPPKMGVLGFACDLVSGKFYL